MPKGYWSHLQTPARQRQSSLGPFPAAVCQCHTLPSREGTENAFHFQLVSQGIFWFCCDTEIKSKGDKSLTRGRICFQISICYGESNNQQDISILSENNYLKTFTADNCLSVFDLFASILSEIELIIRKLQLFCQIYYLFSLFCCLQFSYNRSFSVNDNVRKQLIQYNALNSIL